MGSALWGPAPFSEALTIWSVISRSVQTQVRPSSSPNVKINMGCISRGSSSFAGTRKAVMTPDGLPLPWKRLVLKSLRENGISG